MKKEELAQQYADQKVLGKNEYPLYDLHKRKKLTRFDGFEIEQAFEDGFIKAISSSACLKDAQGDDLPRLTVKSSLLSLPISKAILLFLPTVRIRRDGMERV